MLCELGGTLLGVGLGTESGGGESRAQERGLAESSRTLVAQRFAQATAHEMARWVR